MASATYSELGIGVFGPEWLGPMFDQMPHAVAYCRLEFANDVANDFTVLYANPALHAIAGRTSIAGTRISALIPALSTKDPDFFALYERVVRSGCAETLECFVTSLRQWVSVSAYTPQAGHFITVLNVTTTSKRAEAALAASERRLRAVAESSPVPLALNDRNGIVTYINRAFQNVFGYLPSDIPTLQSWWEAAYPDELYRAWVIQTWQSRVEMAANTDGQFEPLEVTVRCKDGQDKFVIAQSASLGQGDDDPYLVTLFDGTDLILARQALEKARHFAEGVINSVGEGLYLNDLDGRVTYINPVGAKLLGYQSHEVVGKIAHDLFHYKRADGSHFPQEDCAIQKTARSGCTQTSGNELFWRKDGSSFAVQFVSAPLMEDGVLIAVVVTFRDITEHNEVVAELRRSHDLLSKLSDQVPGVFYQFNMGPTGTFSAPFTSSGVMDIFGLSPAQVSNEAHQIFDRVVAEDRDAFVASILVSAEAMGNWVQEFRVRLPDGTVRWREGRARPEREADGGVTWYGFIADATDRMEAKHQRRRMNESLEARVVQRTNELHIALMAAEKATRSRGEFLAKMSHEIRTPLNAMMGMTYMALRSNPGAKERSYLERIHISGGTLLGIVNDILDFSKIDSGKLTLESYDFDLNQTLREVVQLGESKAQEKGLSFVLDVHKSVPRRISGDPLRLGQVLGNYVSNAIKFTERGGITVRVQIRDRGRREEHASNDHFTLCFEVEDTGIGLSEEQRSRLFQPFEQGDNSITRKFGGTGLGLVISKQLANLMGGEVGVWSQVGVGSMFWFTARLRPAMGVVSQSPDNNPAVDDTGLLRGAQILVVDDNEFNREVAKLLLEDVGVQVTMANDGAQALEALTECRFDCVLMDVQMPVMDGVEATRQIRADSKTADLCVIAMTANVMAEDRERYLKVGMNDVVTKPIEPDYLYASLLKWLGMALTGRSNVNPREPDAARGHHASVVINTGVASEPVWDISILTQSVGNDQRTHQRLIEKFLQGAREQTTSLLDAVARGHCSAAADAAHKLKSSSRAVGAIRLGSSCAAVELAGRAGDLDACRTGAAELNQSFIAVDQAIGDWLLARKSA